MAIAHCLLVAPPSRLLDFHESALQWRYDDQEKYEVEYPQFKMKHSNDYAILGFGEEAVYFHHAMSFIGWKLVRCFDLKPMLDSYHGVAILPLPELCHHQEAITNLPLFVCPTGTLGFLEELALIRSVVGPELFDVLKLLHPAAAFDLQDFSFPGRLAHFGMPGAGNIVFQNVFNPLFEEQEPSYNEREKFFIDQTMKHRSTLALAFSDIIEPYIPRATKLLHGVPAGFGRSMFQIANKKAENISTDVPCSNFTYISNISTKRYAWSPFLASHEFPTPEAIANYRRLGVPVLVVVRHPLDLIVSIVRKYTDKLSRFLAMPEFFLGIARCVKDYFDYIEHSRAQIQIFRYEDLTTDPIPTIQRMRELIGLETSKEQGLQLWEKIGFRELAPGHFSGGGYGKSQKYFTTWHYQILKELGFSEVLRREKYEDPLQAIPAFSPARDSERPTPADNLEEGERLFDIASWEAFFHALYGKPFALVGNGFSEIFIGERICGDLTIYSTSPILLRPFLDRAEDPVFRKLLCVLDLPSISSHIPPQSNNAP